MDGKKKNTKGKLSIEEVKHVANLANLPLSQEEIATLQPQLEGILEFVSKLQAVPTKTVIPTSQVTNQVNSLRDDVVDSQRVFSQEDALANAPESYNGFFKVRGVTWE